MTPLPLRRVWMTNVLTGITRERYRFYVNKALAFCCHGHPWDNTPIYSYIAYLRYKNCTRYSCAKMQLRNILRKIDLDKPK
jgi:hypothetical protein